MAKEINAELVSVLMEKYKKQEQIKLERVQKFKSVYELMKFLANAKPKDREAFLRPWKTQDAAPGIGRKVKQTDFEFFEQMLQERHSLELEENKKFLTWKKFLQRYYDKKHPDMPKEKADKKIKTAENKLSRYEAMINKITRSVRKTSR